MVPWLRERATADSNEYVRIAAEQALVTGWQEDPDTSRLLMTSPPPTLAGGPAARRCWPWRQPTRRTRPSDSCCVTARP